jgi:hypothetical protein
LDRRSAKARAARIDLSYFRRPHLLRRSRWWLSLAFPLAALIWISGSDITGIHTVYNPGPLSHSHAVFSNRCELCHVMRAGLIRRHVSDDACLTCHDGPKHQMTQAFSPTCSSCHVEHRGVERIAEVPDTSCTQCHAQLRTAKGTPSVAGTITLFVANHPEFRAKLATARDPGTIKLNHAVHLAAGLKGPQGPVQMECADCHRSNPTAGAWPYAAATEVAATPAPVRGRPQDFPYMMPIKYTQQCAACHALEFDKRFGTEQVPHDKPEVVHKFLVERYRRFLAEHPAGWHDTSPPQLQRIVAESRMMPARSPDQWVEMQVDAAERLLWQKTCKECHTVPLVAASALPEIPKSAIPQRWMQHAAFDHSAHNLLQCESCHTASRKSKETADILLPAIATCRQCHRREQEMGDGADARCSECHVYHDWSKTKRVKSPFTIPQIRGSAPVQIPAEDVSGAKAQGK